MALTLEKAFNPRHNSIGFLRWLMAFAVIFSHAGPLAGYYGSKNLGTQWSDEQSFGGVAVAGFFFLSGFLITKSRMGRSTIFRFFWRRSLRIFPATHSVAGPDRMERAVADIETELEQRLADLERQGKLLDGIAQLKTPVQAAREAGYSESYAKTACRILRGP